MVQSVLQAAVRCVTRQAVAQRAQRVSDIQEQDAVYELHLQAMQPPAGGQRHADEAPMETGSEKAGYMARFVASRPENEKQ